MGRRSAGSVDDVVVDRPRLGAAWLLVGSLAVVGIAGFLLAPWEFDVVATLKDPGLWLAIVAFCVFEMYTIDIPFKSHRHSYSMAEIPVLLGFFYLTPASLVLGCSLGMAIDFFFFRKQRGLKLSFNVSLQFAIVVLQLIVFEAVAASRTPTDASAMIGAYAAIVLTACLGHVMVTAVISLVEGVWAPSMFWPGLWFAIASQLATSSLGLTAVLLATIDWRAVLILVTPILVLYGAYRTMGRRIVAEEKLRASERRFAALIHASSDVTALVGADGVLQYVSDAALGLLDVDPVEARGRPASHLFGDPGSEARFREVFSGVLEGDDAVVLNLRARRPSGAELDLEVNLTNLLPDPGVEAVLMSVRDVTEKRRLEERLLQAQKMDAIGQLAGGVAHDFNNLLAVIQNYASFVKSDLPKDSASVQDVDEILRATEAASTLTRQLLSFARREIVTAKVVDVNDLVSGMHRMLSRTIRESIELRTQLDVDLPRIKIDSGRLEQVLINLAVNAKDAMSEGGTLVVRTYDKEIRPHVASSKLPAGTYVVIEVTDTGVGIPDHVRERVFEPFFTTKGTGKGTGLGLATVYGIVTQFDGHIEVESEVGVGTTFRIYFPATDEDVREENLEPVATAGSGSGTILVAEDADPVRRLVERILSAATYEVLSAPSGAEAFRLWQKHADRVDLLVTDVVMPEMSGRELSELTGLPTVFMSGYTDEIISQEDVDDGGLFLQKPFSAPQLLQTVADALDQHAAARPG